MLDHRREVSLRSCASQHQSQKDVGPKASVESGGGRETCLLQLQRSAGGAGDGEELQHYCGVTAASPCVIPAGTAPKNAGDSCEPFGGFVTQVQCYLQYRLIPRNMEGVVMGWGRSGHGGCAP